jgi:cell division protein FtsB
MKLTKNQINLLRVILMEYCETNDTSAALAAKIDKLWADINLLNQEVKK